VSSPSVQELRDLLAIGLRASEIARDTIMPLYWSGTSVDLKSDGTPVTAADRNAEEAMRNFLAGECPGHGILGEEFGETPASGPYRWVLDPIDGTKSFVHHVPLFGTLIALEHEGEPVVGIIACHAADETASAARGLGASINGSPVRVSSLSAMGDATVLTTSIQAMHRYHPHAWSGINDQARLIRTWGDCYGYLSVAAGRAEAMIDPIMNYWDVAALYPIITEAGGRITTIDGDDRPGESSLATNGLVHTEMLALLALDSKSD
jgi:histidinol-phosphatase